VISCQNNNPKSVRADYIYLNLSKKAKGQTLRKGYALLKDDITNNLEPQKPVIYSETVEKPESGNL